MVHVHDKIGHSYLDTKLLCITPQKEKNDNLKTTLVQKQPHTHTHTFNGPFSRTTQVSRYQKGKTNLDFTEARDSEWQWNQLEHNASLHLAPDR